MKDIMEILKNFEESALLNKSVNEPTKNGAKEQKRWISLLVNGYIMRWLY